MISALNVIKNQFKPGSVAIPARLFYRKEGYSVGDLKLDLILEENHAVDAAVTTHPVQDGSQVADHVYKLLRTGGLRAIVSNWSINDTSTRQGLEGRPPEEIQARAQEVLKSGLKNRAKEAWTTLKGLVGTKVTITTALEVYSDVIVTHIDTTRDEETGEALDFVLEFTEYKEVKLREDHVTASVTQEDMKSALNREASGQLYEGQVVASPATAAEQAKLGG